MIKPICDFTGNSPAKTVSITCDTKVLIQVDLSDAERDKLVAYIQGKITVSDVQPVMNQAKLPLTPEATLKP